MSVISELRGEIEADQARAYDMFLDLAQRIATGKKVEASEVKVVVKASDRSLDDLEEIVGRFRMRPSLRAQVLAGEDVEAQVIAARGEIKQVDDDLAAAQRRHAAAIGAINDRISGLQLQAQQAREAQAKLADPLSCPDERLAQRLISVRNSIASSESRLAGLTMSTFDQMQVRPGIAAGLSELRAREAQIMAEIAAL